MTVTALANAKINLTLDITGRRDDGYHLIKTVMQSVDLCDKITVTENRDCDITVISNNKYAWGGKNNIAYKAAKAFFEYCKITNPGIEIILKKNIPVSAGLAGGSADGAAVIVSLDKIFDTHLSTEDTYKIGLKVGADLPFCITGGTSLAKGIGEEITPLSPMPDCSVVIVKPNIGVSTAKAYELIDSAEHLPKPDTERVISYLKNGDIYGISSSLCNVFEDAIGLKTVTEIRSIMSRFGVLGSQMSGSGSSVFGIFKDNISANKCIEFLKKSYNEVYLCHPAKSGVIIL